MENQTLTPDYRDFFEALHAHRADYLVIGGYAVGLHGHVRATKDIDIWVGRDPLNAERVYQAVIAFAGMNDHVSAEKFTRAGYFLIMGVEPYRLDVITTIPGVEFESCRRRGLTLELDQLPVRVIHLEDLLCSKVAAGRPQDLADVTALTEGDTPASSDDP